jgi:hypothetical protein
MEMIRRSWDRSSENPVVAARQRGANDWKESA